MGNLNSFYLEVRVTISLTFYIYYSRNFCYFQILQLSEFWKFFCAMSFSFLILYIYYNRNSQLFQIFAAAIKTWQIHSCGLWLKFDSCCSSFKIWQSQLFAAGLQLLHIIWQPLQFDSQGAPSKFDKSGNLTSAPRTNVRKSNKKNLTKLLTWRIRCDII